VDQTIAEGDAIETGVKQATLCGQVKGHALSKVKLTSGDGKIPPSGAKIVDADGKDVTGNYNITYAAGQLTVNPKPTVMPKPTVKPTRTPEPTKTQKPTVRPTETPKPTVKPTRTPNPTKMPELTVRPIE